MANNEQDDPSKFACSQTGSIRMEDLLAETQLPIISFIMI
jgi:hypothetical protein